MILYEDKPKFVEPIEERDVLFMGSQIKELVNIYKEAIYIKSEESDIINALNQLDDIANKILKHDYASLVIDTNIIDRESADSQCSTIENYIPYAPF